MQKQLGQDIKDLEKRRQFLLDNADEVVEMDYHKPFDADTLAEKKTQLAETSIKINDLEEEKKDYIAKIGLEIKPLKEEKRKLLSDIKSKGEDVREKCFKIIDFDEKMIGFYNAEGDLISSEPARSKDLQLTIQADIRGKKEAV
jgi:hypothetical protein